MRKLDLQKKTTQSQHKKLDNEVVHMYTVHRTIPPSQFMEMVYLVYTTNTTRKCSCSIGWASERSSGMRARLNDDVPY